MNKKSKQETFDTVARHLITQGVPARDQFGCRYKTTDGLLCAVGCLIPATEYNSTMEGQGLDHVRAHSPSVALHDQLLLMDLQLLHDTSEIDNWLPEVKWQLREMARIENFTVIDELKENE